MRARPRRPWVRRAGGPGATQLIIDHMIQAEITPDAVAARLAAGSPPAEWGWKAFELQAGAAQSNANVTGWGNQPTYNIFGPPGFQTGRTLPE